MTRYIQNGDEITDTKTGLIWQAKSLGPMSWAEAMALEKGGWRVPTISELVTLIDYEKYSPASGFPGMEPEWFWSSSPSANYNDYAWLVNFGNGYVYDSSKYGYYRVRLVRAGQCSAVDELSRLRAELERQTQLLADASAQALALRTECNRQQEWIDAAMGGPVVGFYVYVAEHDSGYVCETEDEYCDDATNHGAEITELIIRPQPLAKE